VWRFYRNQRAVFPGVVEVRKRAAAAGMLRRYRSRRAVRTGSGPAIAGSIRKAATLT